MKGIKVYEKEDQMKRSISELDKAWVAGFFDGEGSAMLMYLKPNKKRGSKSAGWNSKIAISQTKKSVLEFIHDHYEGSIILGRNQKENQNDHWAFVAYSRKANDFLRDIYPYLKLKKRHAEIIMEYYTTVGPAWGSKGLPPEIFDKRLQLALELKQLNKRGKHAKEPKWTRNLES